MKKIFALILFIALPSIVSAATISAIPSIQSVKVGDTFTVNVDLDTQGAPIEGVDLQYLNFDPKLLQAQSVNPTSIIPATMANKVNNDLGQISLSQIVPLGGGNYTGKGTLATVTFKAISSGTADLYLNFTPGATTDTNVAASGTDILTEVVDSSVRIDGPISFWRKILNFFGL